MSIRPFDEEPTQEALDEWMARVSPFLTADDPHQQCIARQRAAGPTSTIEEHCTCPQQHPDDCDKECCRPESHDDLWSWSNE